MYTLRYILDTLLNGRISTQKRILFIQTIEKLRAKGLNRRENAGGYVAPARAIGKETESAEALSTLDNQPHSRPGDAGFVPNLPSNLMGRGQSHVTKPAVETQTDSLFMFTIEDSHKVITRGWHYRVLAPCYRFSFPCLFCSSVYKRRSLSN